MRAVACDHAWQADLSVWGKFHAPSRYVSRLTAYAFACSAPPGVFLPPSPWAWVDPGAFALIGAGAFMGGVTRLTISLAVIMMEVSSSMTMLPAAKRMSCLLPVWCMVVRGC